MEKCPRKPHSMNCPPIPTHPGARDNRREQADPAVKGDLVVRVAPGDDAEVARGPAGAHQQGAPEQQQAQSSSVPTSPTSSAHEHYFFSPPLKKKYYK
jgi:hypothetical protein